MKIRITVLAALGLAAVALAACGGGGGDGDEAAIRTQKGLAVAAAAQTLGLGGESSGQSDENSTPAAPGAPDVVTGGAGRDSVAPDVAPFPYSPVQQSQDGITVQGYGSASADADSAIIEMYFGSKVTGVEPQRDTSSSSGGAGTEPVAPPSEPSLQEAQPITEADLQPVVDAIVSQGVSRDDIEVLVQPSYEPSYGGSATIRATVRNIDTVDAVVGAATTAANSLTTTSLQSTSVTHTVSDCAALEQAAMEAAVADARERGSNFAKVLGVTLGAVAGASNYSSFPYGSPCSGYSGIVPLDGVAYAEGQARQVELVTTVAVTFKIQ